MKKSGKLWMFMFLIFILTSCNRDNGGSVSNKPPQTPKEYIGFKLEMELKVDDRDVISLSNNGKYMLTCEMEEYLTFYVYNTSDSALIKKIELEAADMSYPEGRTIFWSNDGERFAFYEPGFLQTLNNSDINICDIEAGTIMNLTGLSDEGDSLDDGMLLDSLPAWSSDDKSITFSRYSREFRGICTVDIKSKEVKNLHEFSEADYLTAWNALINFDDNIYLNTTAGDASVPQGIVKLVKGKEEMLVPRSGDEERPVLMSVSNDQTKLLYYVIDEVSRELKVMCLDTKTLTAEELKPTTGYDMVVNAIFSPNGQYVLQVERSIGRGKSGLTLVELENMSEPGKLMYETEEINITFGTTSNPLNYRMITPTWAYNDYIAINDEIPILLKAE